MPTSQSLPQGGYGAPPLRVEEVWNRYLPGSRSPLPCSLSSPCLVVRDAGILTDDPDDDVFSRAVTFDGGHHPTFSSLEGWSEDYCAIVAG